MALINSQLTDSVLRRLGKSLVCLCIFFRSNIKDSRFPDVLRKYFHPLWVCFIGTAFSRRGIVFKWGGDLPAPPVNTNCRLNWYWDMVKNTSIITEFLVSKETVVLRRWERSKQKFGFIKRVDKGWITTVKDLESWCFERLIWSLFLVNAN